MNRILYIQNVEEATRELNKINVSSQGVQVMAPKAIGLNIKLENVKLGAANILKQEMLSIGGDAAVARGVVEGKEKISDVILMGNADKIKKIIKKLEYQTIFGLSEIKADLEKTLEQILEKSVRILNCNGKEVLLDKIRIIGVLNVSPDSFSDGNEFLNPDKAVEHVLKMIDEGVDIIDIGGESTRPGAEEISVQTEIQRVIQIIERLSGKVPISIDTYKADVAEAAIQAGASIVNDISALRFDKSMIKVLKKNKHIPIILMHMQGTPRTMQKKPFYQDTISEILSFLKERIDFCISNGISKERILIDPGIGFGKRHSDNLLILKKIMEFHCLNVPIVLGASRKSFIGRIYDSTPKERLAGSLAATALAFQHNIHFVRVHDVKEHKQLLQTLEKVGEAI
ncbi:MAG: dihydropteroate synthase [Armatimonadetes bacterium]|nr:dihydropteroate synthase [Armatimonadota bacterium]